jgi:hypothetical protein
LVERGEKVVEVGQEAVELERVGIPIGEERHLKAHPYECHILIWEAAVEIDKE